ncbi:MULTISPECIES: EscV/YscV/HrcV family type III secretion system export apparatus protein [Providencia]|uniref:EscV/YscV/HrcV family type III secretion system export apparatus protein n=2 Tax=Providencia alcalifaciens TaxID=126385 RepID=A0AAW9VD25_9GAMM|nr:MULTISPECIES: EscV/YscV/HrcV family type III secretion system export apparatus protein [Providencia]ATG15496.1 EscV/YscV/HrcV family type III secretion system export apparatus protein [Providencia alcalifaciens]EEB45337.1 type III secretion protein, HrcV family [Providencia alcalifaciens DSM 30120]EKT63472.1 type III secretion system protein InvA [Providencia alcalifaciens Dmel2]MBF0692131.1 EscV/YscV/HrcV family type III secretion system export apparatus protein [Providencia alcalifaciens]
MKNFTGFLLQIRNRPELMVLVIMVMVIAMLIIPLPTVLVDFLIALNIMISVLIFMSSFYITRVLNFQSFPSILLISTLFRLALSISTSRLILLEADAGDIIDTFGEFVIQDNLVVGMVVFAIVTIVQFIVITKGSERIAEVAARFSLDAMPGKQMSIDADLRAGVIDEATVKIKRGELEKESQLFGSFDGAMKFIKGDAIAGIVIIFVNLIGGISVGTAQQGMDISTALNTFTLLTIGDGLVAQIPALLISISAGFIVTRVGGNDKNLGENIVSELFDNDFTILITALIVLFMGFLPGFPTPIFLFLAALLMGLFATRYFKKRKAQRKDQQSGQENLQTEATEGETQRANDDFDDEYIPETLPVIISVNQEYKQHLEENNFLSRMKKDVFIRYGYRIPDIAINYSPIVPENKIVVLINEVKAGEYDVYFHGHRLLTANDELEYLGLELTKYTDEYGFVNTWFDNQYLENVEQLGLLVRDDITEMIDCVSTLLLRHINEFFGIQETKNLLDDLERKYPELLKECYRHATVQKVTEVFQRLLMEKISVRNMKLIIETLVQWVPKEKDSMMLVEHIRSSMARYISSRFSVEGRLNVLMVNAELEDTIRQGIRQSSGGVYLHLEPEKSNELIQAAEVALENSYLSARDVNVLVPVDIRRFVKKILEGRFPELEVLSFNEVSEMVRVNVIKTI